MKFLARKDLGHLTPVDQTGEEWRAIQSFGGVYEISSLGRVRSALRRVTDSRGRLTRSYGGVLRPERTRLGYLRIRLSANGMSERMLVHRLVAVAFLPPPLRGDNEVNHKNGDKADNRPSNLEWCSRKNNMVHALASGLRQRTYLAGKGQIITPEQARSIFSDGRLQRVLAEEYGVSPTLVSNIKSGRAWSTVTGADRPS